MLINNVFCWLKKYTYENEEIAKFILSRMLLVGKTFLDT